MFAAASDTLKTVSRTNRKQNRLPIIHFIRVCYFSSYRASLVWDDRHNRHFVLFKSGWPLNLTDYPYLEASRQYFSVHLCKLQIKFAKQTLFWCIICFGTKTNTEKQANVPPTRLHYQTCALRGVKAKLKQHRDSVPCCRSGGVGLGSRKHIRIRKIESRGPIPSQRRPTSPKQHHLCRHDDAPARSRGWRRVHIHLMETNKQRSIKLHKGHRSKANQLPVTLIMIRVSNCILLPICRIDHLCGVRRRLRNITAISIRIENLDQQEQK